MTVGRSARGTVWNIQILRFVAAAMVLFSHLNHEAGERAGLAAGFRPFEPIWWAGGVDVFFVISGFIMTYIAADSFGRPGAAAKFVERRLVRLVPPYWFFTMLALATMAVLPGQMTLNRFTPGQVLGSFLFVPFAANPDGRPWPVLVLGWTLNFEMLFYAVFAGALLLGRRAGLATIAAALGGIALLSLAQPLPLPLGFWANGIVLEFLFGIALALAYRRGVRLPAWSGAVLVAVAIGILLWVKAEGWAGAAWNWRFLWAGGPALLLCAGVALVPEREPGAMRRALILLGDASFALYLSHPFVLSALALVAEAAGLRSAALYIAAGFGLCIVTATLFYMLVEKPFYTWMTARLVPVGKAVPA